MTFDHDEGPITDDLDIDLFNELHLEHGNPNQQILYYPTIEGSSTNHLLLQYSMMVISSYGALVSIVALTRLLHLAIDLLNLQNNDFKNIVTIVLGCYQLSEYFAGFDVPKFGSEWCLGLSVVLMYVICARLAHRSHASTFSILALPVIILPIIINEYYIHIKLQYHHTPIRVILMTLSMKLISELSSEKTCEILELTAYFVHPASCICGPWHRNNLNYGSTSSYFVELKRQICCATKNFIIAVVILFISDILLDNLIQQLGTFDEAPLTTRALLVYLYAQQFRSSHYFICYLSMSFISLWGDARKPTEVCKPLQVEWPRSLVSVVIYWNVPMHKWLKDYIFNPLRVQTNNKPLIIMMTYLVSSTLHGFKFHIWSVLFSLGLFTWIEENSRLKLSQLLSACILTKECRYSKKNCSRGHTRTIYNSYIVRVINFSFRIWAISQLAYLGYIFKVNTDESNYKDAIHSWSELYFYGHVAAFILWTLSSLFQDKTGNREMRERKSV